MKERKFISNSVNKLLITEYIKRQTDEAGFGGMEMKRTPFGTNIALYVNKPGLVIGHRGSRVQEITAFLESRYKVESPQIEVKEISNPDLNPQVVSKKIALSLEKGWHYRKAGNTSLRRVIEGGSKGVMIRIGGKISGERARTQKFTYGSVKYSGEPGRIGMEVGYSQAKMKLGIIGVKVSMLRSDYRLPDKINPVIKIEAPAVEKVSEPEVSNKVENVEEAKDGAKGKGNKADEATGDQ